MRSATLGLFIMLAVGCDKAEPAYNACLGQQGKNNVLAAESCKAAVAADPSSRAGKAAAGLLAKMEADERAAADERLHLLASVDPNDWANLIAKYPDSAETTGAKEKQGRASSSAAASGTSSDLLFLQSAVSRPTARMLKVTTREPSTDAFTNDPTMYPLVPGTALAAAAEFPRVNRV